MDTSIQYDKSQYQSTTSRVSDLLNEIHALKQSRSNFALAHFVVCAHDTPGRQRMQVLDELEAALFYVMDTKDDLSLALIDQAEFEATISAGYYDAQRNDIKVARNKRKIINLQMQIDAKTREMVTLLGILDSLPTYTREQIEAEEPEYWNKRLSRQAYLSQQGAYTAMGEGNLDAIMQTQDEPGAMNRISMDTTQVLNLIGAPMSVQSVTPTQLEQTGG